MNVVGKREWCICPVDLVGYSAVEPLGLQHFIPDWVIPLACRAHKVEEDLHDDSSASFTLNPARVLSIDRN